MLQQIPTTMIKILDQQNSILSRYVAQMRDEVTQRDPMRFRRNLERSGEVIAYVERSEIFA